MPSVTPSTVKSINGWLTVFWTVHQPIVIALYFLLPEDGFQRFCLLYLAIASVWANQASHFSAWIAGRVEVRQEESDG